MAYDKQHWLDQIEDKSRLDPSTGKPFVVQKGTAVTANKMNHIEDGIFKAHEMLNAFDNATNEILKKNDELTTEILDIRMQYEFDGHARKLGITSNMYWVTFRDNADIYVHAGKYDNTQKKLIIP